MTVIELKPLFFNSPLLKADHSEATNRNIVIGWASG
jgi:hypothetical protein